MLLLKRPGLHKEEMKNYRPISNIYQSAYCRGHSTETGLLKAHCDISEALDEGSMTVLIMLDLSAAFDVIDHSILLKRLEFSFGIKEKALSWVKLNLAYRTQCVSVANKTSPDVGFLFGVPQGSVLGPKN